MAYLNFLSVSEIESIHQATLRILDEIGIILKHKETQELLTSAGARMDGERVKFPPELRSKDVHPSFPCADGAAQPKCSATARSTSTI